MGRLGSSWQRASYVRAALERPVRRAAAAATGGGTGTGSSVWIIEEKSACMAANRIRGEREFIPGAGVRRGSGTGSGGRGLTVVPLFATQCGSIGDEDELRAAATKFAAQVDRLRDIVENLGA